MTRSHSDRCPTTSGRFVCSAGAAGHVGECVTREEAAPWVGPARQPRHLALAVAARDAEHRGHVVSLEGLIRRAETRAHNAEARAGMTHVLALQDKRVSSRIVESSGGLPIPATTLAQDALSSAEGRAGA